jgi:hypothetical protein
MAADFDVAAEQLSDRAGTCHPEEADPASRAILHEEVVSDRRDVAADLAEIDRLGIREAGGVRPLRAAQSATPGATKSMPDSPGRRRARRSRRPATATSEIERSPLRPISSRSPEPSAARRQARSQIAPIVLDLVDDGEHLVAAETTPDRDAAPR